VHANINDKPGPQVFGESPQVWGTRSPGQGGRSQILLSPVSFFQAHTTRRLLSTNGEAAGSSGAERKRSMCIAESEASLSALPGRRPGYWSQLSAVAASGCRGTPELNGCANCFFRSGERRGSGRDHRFAPDPKVVTLNPPRSARLLGSESAGLNSSEAHDLRLLQPGDPGRDLDSLPMPLCRHSAQPVDMFPQTAHIETWPH